MVNRNNESCLDPDFKGIVFNFFIIKYDTHHRFFVNALYSDSGSSSGVFIIN